MWLLFFSSSCGSSGRSLTASCLGATQQFLPRCCTSRFSSGCSLLINNNRDLLSGSLGQAVPFELVASIFRLRGSRGFEFRLCSKLFSVTGYFYFSDCGKIGACTNFNTSAAYILVWLLLDFSSIKTHSLCNTNLVTLIYACEGFYTRTTSETMCSSGLRRSELLKYRLLGGDFLANWASGCSVSGMSASVALRS